MDPQSTEPSGRNFSGAEDIGCLRSGKSPWHPTPFPRGEKSIASPSHKRTILGNPSSLHPRPQPTRSKCIDGCRNVASDFRKAMLPREAGEVPSTASKFAKELSEPSTANAGEAKTC